MSPDETMTNLIERTAEAALDLIDKHGHFFPFALGLDDAGESYWIMADADDPNAEYDPDEWAASVENQLRTMIADGTLEAAAFAEDVVATFEEGDERIKMRAVRIDVDHAEKADRRAHLTFDSKDGKAEPGQLFSMDLPLRFFEE